MRRLGAIAAALVGATALGTWQLAVRTRTESPTVTASTPPTTTATESVAVPAPGSVPGAATVVTPVREARRARPEAGATYAEEIGRLRGVIAERSDELDPATVAVLQHSMATIDSAISQARAALARDPGSRFLNEQLNLSLQRKLGLLRTAALLPST
jgi:hypothetical protein